MQSQIETCIEVRILALVDVVKWDMNNDATLVWKFPSDKIHTGSQLIVSEGQEAIFLRGGVVLDRFGPGTFTLTSKNLPLLDKVVNLPFGGNTPFSAEVWFVNKLQKLDLRWGTKSPISLFDSTIGMPVNIRSYGRWGFQAENIDTLLKKIVGNQSLIHYERLTEFLTGKILQSLTETISDIFKNGQKSIFQISEDLQAVSFDVRQRIEPAVEELGLQVLTFEVVSINMPEEELKTIREVYQKTFEARELSKASLSSSYTQIKAFESATNQSGTDTSNLVGAVVGAGVGLSVAAPIVREFGGENQQTSQEQSSQNAAETADPVARLKLLKNLLDEGLISEDEYQNTKNKILGSI